MPDAPIQERFAAALDALVEQVRQDRAVLAALLCGSLSYDRVWEKSDIDLVLVTVDDKASPPEGLALYSDGLNIHAILMTRTEFRTVAEGAMRQSFMHSFLAKGRLLFTHDPTIADLFARLADEGARDRRLQRLRAAMGALPALYKAHKWITTRGDLEYTALYLLGAASSLAVVEVLDAGQLVDREALPQALALNPGFFDVVYRRLLNERKTRAAVQAALDAADAYLADRAEAIFEPVLTYLREAGEARSCSDIDAHFKRHVDISCVTAACEYLADQGLIGKGSIPVRLTKKSSAQVQELAFFPLGHGRAAAPTAAGLGDL